MEKLGYEKQNVYKLEVNDKGEYIEFDLLDIDLPNKVMNAYKNLEKEQKNAKLQEQIIYKKYADNETKKYEEIYKIQKEYFKNTRQIFDSFLGEGACQKIFGNTDRYGMFDDLLEALYPHLEKMQIDIENIKKSLVEKYLPNKKNVI